MTGPAGSADLWSPEELRLMEVDDELAESTDLGEDAWGFLRERYDDQQIIEFILLVGWYRTVSSLCNVLHIPGHPERVGEALSLRFSVVPWLAALAGLRKGGLFGLAWRHRSANASPMPLAAPVTTAVFPSSVSMSARTSARLAQLRGLRLLDGRGGTCHDRHGGSTR
ncbi:MAG: hypothetical protein OES13_10685, partial [Acidimicrobiia bacterium]|nr:hypothetical protein [Acidimicrobiia bacterium]